MLGWNKLIDSEVFYEIIDGDVCHLDTIIALFEEQAEENLEAMERALKQSDIQAFERAAHDLKNLGRNIAAQKLIDYSDQLESLAINSKFDEASDRLGKIKSLLKRAKEELNSLRKKWS